MSISRSFQTASAYGVAILLAVAGSAGAQAAISPGDSVSRVIAGNSAESVFVALRDGDYAKLDIAHSSGLVINVIRPNGSLLRPFITPDLRGTHSIPFVAEGAGRYAVAVRNTEAAAAKYTVVFREAFSLDERTRAVPAKDEAVSPRISAIRQQIDSGKTSTADFWSAITREGTPLVEPYDAGFDLVTFLWRAEGDTRNVFLVATFSVPGPPNEELHRIGSTDIWYLTLKLPKGARFRYQLEPNRPSTSGVARVTRQIDAFNRGSRFECPSGASKYRCWSIAELPEASPQQWLAKRTGVPTGTITQDTIHSAIQNVYRPLTVYTPAGYTSGKEPYSLVVLFDGDEYLEPDWHGPETWDNLIAAGGIQPFIVVMVHNLPGRRLYDLVANPTFGNFMATELVPWVWAHFNVSHKAGETVIGGASAGGFGATYMGLAHPEVFGKVLSMSGAFWWSPEHNGGICAGACPDPNGEPAFTNRDATTEPNWLAQLALKQPAARAQFYLAAGTFEFDASGTAAGILEENRHLRDILRARNYPVVFHQFVGGHDDLSWRGLLGDGLLSLLKISR